MLYKFIQILLLTLLLGCQDPVAKKIETSDKRSSHDFHYLYQRLQGQRREFEPGNYDRTKTRLFFVDRHNYVVRDELLDSILYKKNILATDSLNLKTVVLVYNNINKFPIGKLIRGTNRQDSSDFIICYLDLETLKIKKIVTLNDTSDFRKNIGRKIAETF